MDTEKYVIVSPVRDEEDNIEETIRSVLSQTVRPAKWVIVDDGSSDGTGKIVDTFAERVNWIESVRRKDRGYRKAGGGVVAAFYQGFAEVCDMEWDYLVKLDGDLSFHADYFEGLLAKFQEDPSLGIAGGDVYNITQSGSELEVQPRFHVRGATKIYRRGCWEAIGGLLRAPGWDTLDEVKANMLGWRTRSFSDYHVLQHRITGGADGAWKNFVKNGRANYISGYHPAFVAAKCAKRMFAPPYLLGALGILTGYVSGYLNREPQVADGDLVRYLREQQMNRLVFKPSIWR